MKHRKKPSIISAFFTIDDWRQVSRPMITILLFYTLMGFYDAFFWTIGPLVAEGLHKNTPFGGLFLTAYYIPVLFVSWTVGSLSHKFGKKRTAFVFMLFGSLTLSTIGLFDNPTTLIAIVFISATFGAIAWPAIHGASADYISESPAREKEIEVVTDFASNAGFIIGPVIAGFLADKVGNIQSFSVLGIISALVTCFILKTAPKKIYIPN
jgi:MFS family permease